MTDKISHSEAPEAPRAEKMTPEEAARVTLMKLRADTNHHLFGVYSEDPTDSVNLLVHLLNQSEFGEIGMLKFEHDGNSFIAFFNAQRSLAYWLSGAGDSRINGTYSFISFEHFVQERLREYDFGLLTRPWVGNKTSTHSPPSSPSLLSLEDEYDLDPEAQLNKTDLLL